MQKNRLKRAKKKEDLGRILEEIAEAEAAVYKQLEMVAEADPFWSYEPSSGEVVVEGRELLRKWVKEGDIPSVFEGQESVHRSLASIVGVSGGNQSGKSCLTCIETLIKVTKQVPDSMVGWYPREKIPKKDVVHYRVVAEDYTNGLLKNVIPTYKHWVPKDWLIDGVWEKSFSEKSQTLTLGRKGKLFGTIEFMSNQQDLGSFQGPARDGIVYDEEPRYDIYRENLLRMTTAGRTDILFGMTPTKGMSWTHNIATQSEYEGSKVDWYKMSTVTNKRANLRVLDEILAGLASYDEIKMRLLGEYVSLSGLVYGSLFNPRVHVIPAFETSCLCGSTGKHHSANCPYELYLGYMGVDAHMVKPSCSALCFLDREGNFIVDTCYKKKVDTEEFKADLLRMMWKRRVDWTVFDPSNDSSITVFNGRNIFWEMTHGPNRLGRSFKADKFHGSIAAGVDEMKKRLKVDPNTKRPTFYIMNRPENKDLIQSFQTLERDTFANEDIKGQKDRIREGVHDHHACVRYIMQSKLRWKPYAPIEPVHPIPDQEAILV